MQRLNRERLNFLWRHKRLVVPYWDKLLVINLSSAIGVGFSMLLPLFSKFILDFAYPQKSIYLFNIAVVGSIAISIVTFIFSQIANYLEMYLAQRITTHLQKDVFSLLMAMPLSFHQQKSLGEKNILLQRDTELISAFFYKTMPKTLQALFSMIIACYVIVRLNMAGVLLVLATVPIYFLISRFIAHCQRSLRQDLWDKTRELFNHIFEKLNFIKTVKSFNKGVKESYRHARLMEDKVSLERENFFYEGLSLTLRSLFTGGISGIILYYAAYRVIVGQLSIGDIAVLALYLTKLYTPVMDIMGIYQSSLPLTISIDRLIEIAKFKKEEDCGYREPSIQGQITLKGVWFKYNAEAGEVLKDINLDIHPYSITAICGSTGIGKTTLIDLMMRFYAPDRGKIFIDGIDAQEMKINSLRSQIAVVPQEYHLFQASIRENILYGNEQVSEEEFLHAVKLARVDKVITGFSEGFDTILGGTKGINLSSGQRQLIAIARAMLCNPKILILDEATSALDAYTESDIRAALKKLRQQMTIIVIAHRLSTIQDADTIVMLEDKTIREAGSFQELIAKEGIFYRYYKMQYANGGRLEYSRDS